MEDRRLNFHKVKKKYLKFLTSQEVMSEPFRDKLGQLNKFYLPISKMIAEDYLCLLYTSPSPRDQRGTRMPSSA